VAVGLAVGGRQVAVNLPFSGREWPWVAVKNLSWPDLDIATKDFYIHQL
jgi:hypothetical protein